MSAPDARPTILVIEDNHDLRQLFGMWLRVAGYHVREAGDGIDALQILEAGDIPDAVVLDLGLPMLDGVSVRLEIAARPATQHVPVIVVTGATQAASNLNVVAILKKPVAEQLLLAAVHNAVSRSRKR